MARIRRCQRTRRRLPRDCAHIAAGHTRGHACVAVDAGHRWILHYGDAFYHYGTLDGLSRVPCALTAMESVVAWDLKKVRQNHARLAELYQRQDPDLFIVNAHDPTLYQRARDTA